MGSNLRVIDTEPQTRAPLWASPDAQRDPTKVMEDAPLSDQGDANDDIEMADAEVIEAEQPDGDGGSAPRRSPDPEEVPERIPDQPVENPDEIPGEGDPQVPKDPQDDSPQPHRQVLQGFRTVAQTFSAAYGSTSSDIQQVIRRSLRESTNDDRTFIYGASNTIRRWVESVCPAMAGNDTEMITCSFQHQMDEMAINLLFPGSQLVPNVWSAHWEVLEGLSLVAPPSCSASWPASLVEPVAPVPGTSGQSGSAKTPTKPGNPGAGKLAPGSGKKTQPIQQAAGMFWGDKKKREKEDADAQAQEEKRWKKPSRPILSLDEHEHSITELTNQAAPSRSTQPSSKNPSSTPKDWVRPRKDPMAVPDPSDDEPLSDQANKPKAKARKQDPTPELVVVDNDNSTPLPGKQKTPKKSLPVEEEATEKLVQRLKGEARAVQYNLELAALVDYRNKSVPNLKGPPNTDDHSKYLSKVRDISWSYPAKGNLWTAQQFFQELQACKNREMVEQGEAVLRDRGMLGIPQESRKSGPIKARYVIRVLRSVEGRIIDARDSDYGRDWNIGLYDIVSAASTKKVEKTWADAVEGPFSVR